MNKWYQEKGNRDWLWRVVFSLGLAIALPAVVAMSADAAPVEMEDNGSGMFRAEYAKLPDDSKATYYIDLAEPKEEEGGFMDSVLNPLDTVAAKMSEGTDAMLLKMTNLALSLNMTMTNTMIGVLNFGFDVEIVNALVDGIEQMVQNISGLSGTNINGGLFGSLIGFAVIATGLSMVYQMFVTRSQLGSLQTVFKSVVAIGLAMLMFSNFGPLIKTMNEAATELSAMVMAGTVNIIGGDNRTSDEIRDDVSANLWDSFIARPYMILQYGTDDIELIGEERVNELLAYPVGPERQEYVNDIELAERGNETMAIGNILDRASFAIMFTTINAIVSLPIFGLTLALIMFSVWYLLIACIAPFVLVWAAFPGQFGVLKRYFIELTYPLVCKVIVTVLTLFVFTLGFLAYSIPASFETTGIPQYYTTAALQFAMFLGIFFMRKRITKIFKSGDKGVYAVTDIADLKTTMDSAMTKMTHFAVTTAATAVGGTAGGATAGYVMNKYEEREEAETNETNETNETTHVKPLASVQETRAAEAEMEPVSTAAQPLDKTTEREDDGHEHEAGPAPVEKSIQEEREVEPATVGEGQEEFSKTSEAPVEETTVPEQTEIREDVTAEQTEVREATETVAVPAAENPEYETEEYEEEEDLSQPFARLNESVPVEQEDEPFEEERKIPAERGEDHV